MLGKVAGRMCGLAQIVSGSSQSVKAQRTSGEKVSRVPMTMSAIHHHGRAVAGVGGGESDSIRQFIGHLRTIAPLADVGLVRYPHLLENPPPFGVPQG